MCEQSAKENRPDSAMPSHEVNGQRKSAHTGSDRWLGFSFDYPTLALVESNKQLYTYRVAYA